MPKLEAGDMSAKIVSQQKESIASEIFEKQDTAFLVLKRKSNQMTKKQLLQEQ